MKRKLSKRAKILIGAAAFAGVAVVLPTVILTSCSASANPYGPYSVISGSPSNVISTSSNNLTNYSGQIIYNTKEKSYTTFNGDGNIIPNTFENGAYKNKWINASDVKKYYNYVAHQSSVKFITNIHDKNAADHEADYQTLLKDYLQYTNSSGMTPSQQEAKIINTIGIGPDNKIFDAGIPNFFYGAKVTNEMKTLAGIYNNLTIMSSVYGLVSQLANEMLQYAITSEAPDTYQWLANNQPKPTKVNPLSISTNPAAQNAISLAETNSSTVSTKTTNINPAAQKYANESIMQLGNQIANNPYAKELTISRFGLGQGYDSYFLWPSGFNAKFKVLNSQGKVVTNLLDGQNINQPYPMINDNPSIAPEQFTLNVSDITVNYQWYKGDNPGGNYITPDSKGNLNINSQLDNQQKEMLSYSGFKDETPGKADGYIHTVSYKLPIGDLNFNLIPLTEGYTDPIYGLLKDFIYNGIYSIQPPLAYYGKEKIDPSIKIPTLLKSRGQTPGVNWQCVNSTVPDIKSNKYENTTDSTVILGDKLYNEILNQNLPQNSMSKASYYYSNTEGWTANTSKESAEHYESPFTLASSTNNKNLLTYYQARYFADLLQNPYGSKTAPVSQRPIANNFNVSRIYNFKNIWALGWMLNNYNNTNVEQENSSNSKDNNKNKIPVNEMNPLDSKAYKTMSNAISTEGLYKYLDKNPSEATIFKTGLKQFYQTFDIANTTAGDYYSIDYTTGKIVSKSGKITIDPNPKTTK